MIYFYNPASTFNITILSNLAPKWPGVQTAGGQTAGAQKSCTPTALHLSAEISDDFLLVIYTKSPIIYEFFSQGSFFSRFQVHATCTLCTNDSISQKSALTLNRVPYFHHIPVYYTI